MLCLDAQSCPTLSTLWTVTCKDPLSLGFHRQEYRSGLPFLSPQPGIEPASPALAGGFFTTEPPRKLKVTKVELRAAKWLVGVHRTSK